MHGYWGKRAWDRKSTTKNQPTPLTPKNRSLLLTPTNRSLLLTPTSDLAITCYETMMQNAIEVHAPWGYKTRQAASQCERCAVPSTRLKSQMSEVWWFVCIASPFPDRRLSSVLPTSWSYLSFACQRLFVVPNADIQLFAMLVNPGWFVVNGC